MFENKLRALSIALTISAAFFPPGVRAYGENIVVGVNVVNPMRASVGDQNAVLAQLHAAGVHVIRCGISLDSKGIDFAKRAAARGIRIQLIVSPSYPPNSPSRPYRPAIFPSMWGGHPLSSADPALSKASFQSMLDQLDSGNSRLAGIELGNEINWAAFNAEFPLPGEGKILVLSDLYQDPEGEQIAKGFLQYLKILAELKSVRDRSRLNAKTPIILAGLVSAKDGEKLYNNKKEDMVGLAATITFLRTNGLDALVDAYGIHSYPAAGGPGDRAAAAKRAARLSTVDLAACRAADTPGGKPCWITEWGFPNTSLSCPLNDAGRTLLVKEVHADFEKAAAQRRLIGIDLFSWNSDPWSKQPDADSVYRCGKLTPSGREAIKPIKLGP
jgi:hypothetical protein